MAIKRAKTPFGYMKGDPPVPMVVNPGMLFDDSDPVVARFPDYFEDVETHVSERKAREQANVEAATAAPGERRQRSAPRRTRSSAKKADDKKPTEEEQAAQLGLVDSDDSD